MLLAINSRYWQAGKIARMHMTVQGRLMEARVFEIQQIFAKTKEIGYFSNIVVDERKML